MSFTASILVNLVQPDNSRAPLPGVRVSFYDRDKFTSDDLLGTGRTNDEGVAKVIFTMHDYLDEVIPGKPVEKLPDVYVVVHGANNQVVATTKSKPLRSVDTKIEITVTLDKAIQHGLILLPKPQSDDKPPTELPNPCLTRVLIDMVAGALNPQNELQKKLALNVPRQHLERVSPIANAALDKMDRANLSGRRPECHSGRDPKDLWNILCQTNTPLSNIAKGLGTRDPSPKDDLPPSSAGLPFLKELVWDKNCLIKYMQAHNGNTPEPTMYVAAPQVNRIRCYDNTSGKFIRSGIQDTKKLTIYNLDSSSSSGWGEKTINMDVSLDSSDCLIKKADATGRQIMAVDVLPFQTVVFYGSGFIADKARIIVKRYPWKPNSNSGMLEPEEMDLPIIGNNQDERVAVYGAAQHPINSNPNTFTGDYVVFDWPERFAEEGLYEVQLEFENQTNPPYPSHARQIPSQNCRIETDYKAVTTESVWFSVIPALEPRMASPRVKHVRCDDHTDPEKFGPVPILDDMFLQTSAHVRIIPVLTTEGQRIAENVPGAVQHGFIKDGNSWNLDLHLLSSSNDPIRLDFDRILAPHLTLSEIYGDTDKTALTIILSVMYVALLILLTVLLAAAITACVAAAMAILVAAGAVSGGTATAIGASVLIALLEFFTPVVVAVWAVILPAGLAAIKFLVNRLPIGPKLIVSAGPIIQGIELARLLSPYRIHQQLLTVQRPQRLDSTAVQTTIDRSDQVQPRMIEKYTGKAYGGTYTITLDIVSPLA